MSETVLELLDVRAGYGTIEVLHGVSLAVGRGEVLALLGPNGGGKSTTLKVISGLVDIMSGDVHLASSSVAGVSADKLAQPWPLDAGFDEVLRFAAAGLSQDFLPKMIGGVESHDAPPGTHLTAAALTLWRWSWAAPIAAILAWK